jgi:hypothetical protein
VLPRAPVTTSACTVKVLAPHQALAAAFRFEVEAASPAGLLPGTNGHGGLPLPPMSGTAAQPILAPGLGATKVCCVCVLRVRAFVAGTRARLHLVVLSSGVCVHVCMCACMRINACGALMSGVRAAAAQGP